MAFLIKNGVIINDERELVGVNTAGITTALYVGENIQLDAQSGVITATKYAGSGADLTDIVATVIVSDGIPTGISTVEGDLYYDSTDLTLFTYYDNNWVDAAPVPPGATELDITNAAGISTVSIDLLTESLKLDGTANQVSVTLNPGGNGVSFGLESEVAIAGSMTAGSFYGDASGLVGLTLDPLDFFQVAGIQAGIVTVSSSLDINGNTVNAISTDLSGTNLDSELVTALAVENALGAFTTGSATTVTSFDDQTATDYPMPFLSAVGAGASIYTDSSLNEEFTYNPSTGILKVKEFDALSDARLKTEITGIEDALGKVASLRGVEYDWKNGSGSSVGVIAQEVQEVYPQLVNDNGERLTVNYNGLVGLLIAAVNEMSTELAELKAQK